MTTVTDPEADQEQELEVTAPVIPDTDDEVEQQDDVTDSDDEDRASSRTLYNVYRPRKFADVVGQEAAVNGLRNSVVSKKPQQTYLFVGNRGCGKTTSARIFAAALNCKFSQGDGEPCGECDDCLATFDGNAASGTYELNATNKRGIHEMREFLQQLTIGIAQSDYNVNIIDEVQQLTPEAQSLMLKDIEEPQSDRTIFILCTTNPEKLKDTIRSRATRVHFRNIDDQDLKGLAEKIIREENLDVDGDDIDNIVKAGRGSARDMVSNLQAFCDGYGVINAGLYQDIMEYVVDRNVGQALVTIKQHENEIEALGFLEYAALFYGDLILYGQNRELVDGSERYMNTIKRAAENGSPQEAIRFMQVTSDALARVRSSGSNTITLIGYVSRVCIQEGMTSNEALSREIQKLRKDVSELKSAILSGDLSNVKTDPNPWQSDDTENNDNWLDESSIPGSEKTTGGRKRRRRAIPKDIQSGSQGDSEEPVSRRKRSTSAETPEPVRRRSDASNETGDNNDTESDDKPRRRRRRRKPTPEENLEATQGENSDTSDDSTANDDTEREQVAENNPEEVEEIGSDFETKWKELIESGQLKGRLRDRVESAQLSRNGDTLVVKTDIRLSDKAKGIIDSFFDSTEYRQG